MARIVLNILDKSTFIFPTIYNVVTINTSRLQRNRLREVT